MIKSGDRVFLHGSAQTPVYMISELAKEAGRLRQEGKEYIVQDGDVLHFKFNV